jgi:uncharacterized NAD(P)/FAD-binding protein YdhS
VTTRSKDLSSRDRGVLRTSAVVVFLALHVAASEAEAQLLRGSVRLRDATVAVDGARVVAEDRRGRTLGATVTDADGRYRLTITAADSTPFRIAITRIGMQPMLSDEYRLALTDTLDADLFVRELPPMLDEVSSTADPSLNARRFAEARRRGWRVYDPITIEARRASSSSLNELLRSLGAPGLIVPQRAGECVRTTRNGQCLAVIIDNVLVSGAVHLNPRDIYFLAVVSAPDARLEWGDRAGFGALAIYTRMAGDPRRP